MADAEEHQHDYSQDDAGYCYTRAGHDSGQTEGQQYQSDDRKDKREGVHAAFLGLVHVLDELDAEDTEDNQEDSYLPDIDDESESPKTSESAAVYLIVFAFVLAAGYVLVFGKTKGKEL